jgi:hypothetical protein
MTMTNSMKRMTMYSWQTTKMMKIFENENENDENENDENEKDENYKNENDEMANDEANEDDNDDDNDMDQKVDDKYGERTTRHDTTSGHVVPQTTHGVTMKLSKQL